MNRRCIGTIFLFLIFLKKFIYLFLDLDAMLNLSKNVGWKYIVQYWYKIRQNTVHKMMILNVKRKKIVLLTHQNCFFIFCVTLFKICLIDCCGLETKSKTYQPKKKPAKMCQCHNAKLCASSWTKMDDSVRILFRLVWN